MIINIKYKYNDKLKKGNTIEAGSFYELLDAKDSIYNEIFYYEVASHQ